ncbi:MAG: hypothetical protein WC375_02730 [Methanomassiliicoccales archaeon]|jgi:hypothetical protein
MKIFNSKNLTPACLFVLGTVIGIFSTLSFLRTEWTNFSPDFFFWTSIVTTILSLLLLCFSIWQHLAAETGRVKGDAQVKIWMEAANGISRGLQSIAINGMPTNDPNFPKYSSVRDMGMAVYAFSDSAKALYQSLYEERCVTETEYSRQQKEIGDALHAQRLNKIKEEAGNKMQN